MSTPNSSGPRDEGRISAWRENVNRDAQDISGFFGTVRGGWTVIGLGVAIVACSIFGFIWSH